MNENEVSRVIITEAIYVHRSVGPGMLESVYTQCLAYRLQRAGLLVQREVAIPLIFEEIKFECGYRADLLVERKVVIEIKSIDAIAPIHLAQTLTYIKLLDLRLGLLLNFNTILMKDGVRRIVNRLY